MYNSSNQYPDQTYQSSYPNYQSGYGGNYGYQNYGTSYPNNSTPAPPGETYPHNSWGPSTTNYAKDDKKDAVAHEMQQQKAQLTTQREDYVKKLSVLRRELELLRDQKHDLLADGTRDRDLEMILKENDKLQEEIQGKMKAIINVIEMLSSIIKDGKKISDLEAELQESPNRSKSPSNGDAPSMYQQTSSSQSKYCYVHYDTGLHWCRVCDEFPETAKDLLVHLQGSKHMDKAKQHDVGDCTPWHKLPAEPLLPSTEGAPQRRVPIKGLQFFISAPSWYCKLCDVWIGDLHCASHHLKSQTHYQNYESFIEQNPQWEIDWIKDRDKAKSRAAPLDSSEDDDNSGSRKKKKRKDKRGSVDSSREKKKKKRSKRKRKDSSDSSSSSSSSDSSSEEDRGDKSKSIRVAMRNVKAQSIMEEDLSGKWSVLERLVEEHKKKEEMLKEREKPKTPEQDKLISQWMTVSEPPAQDRYLLDSLKDRMKQKQDVEKQKMAELEKQRYEQEKLELEEMERRKREARERADEAERLRKQREQDEYNRIIDKQRNQVKFKTNYRKRHSDSEEEERNYKEESPRRYRSDSNSERARSRSISRETRDEKKKPPRPSYKKLPFIGRMPLFKNKKPESDKIEKEIKKEEYEKPRRTRFEPGNLPRAFIPKPDVVCFPKLSSIPPLTIPPPPSVTPAPTPRPPSPPKIGNQMAAVPPPPKIGQELAEEVGNKNDQEDFDPDNYIPPTDADMDQYYDYNQMYSQMYDFQQEEEGGVPHAHTLPLEPPPLPPDDDLAMLGICADDMAAQSF